MRVGGGLCIDESCCSGVGYAGIDERDLTIQDPKYV